MHTIRPPIGLSLKDKMYDQKIILIGCDKDVMFEIDHLSKNIIESVSDILELHNNIIVVEDDILTSKAFLKYMNDALNFYQDNKNVFLCPLASVVFGVFFLFCVW